MLQQAREFKGIINSDEEAILIDTLGLSSIALQIDGTFVGTIEFEGSVNGSDWDTIPLWVPETSALATDTTTIGLWIGSCAGLRFFRVKSSAWTSGTANISLIAALSGGGAGAGGGGGAANTDGDAFTAGVSEGTGAMGVYEATPTTLADGEMGLVGLTADRAIRVSLNEPLDRTADTISSAIATDAIMNGDIELTPKYAVIDAATSGDNTLVAAVTSPSNKKIRVLACYMIAAAAVNVRFESGAGGTALTGQSNLTTNSGFVLPFNPVGWFETTAGALLNLELSGAVSVDGSLVYVEV